jgi:hypothetical protein
MPNKFSLRIALLVLTSLLWPGPAQSQADTPSSLDADLTFFAVEIRIGAKWDHSKAAHEQLYFGEHSANLKRLRDAGSLIAGARYGDKGLVILAAATQELAEAMMDDDPSIGAEVFQYEIHPMNVFYPGTLE